MNCCQGPCPTLSPSASLYLCSLLPCGMSWPSPRLPPTKALHSCRLSSAQLLPSATIPTPSLRASSFHQGPISPSAPSFSPISLPPPPASPSSYAALQLPGPGKRRPLSLLRLPTASPHVFSLGGRGSSPGHSPSWTVPSRDEVPNRRMPQQPALGRSNIKFVP